MSKEKQLDLFTAGAEDKKPSAKTVREPQPQSKAAKSLLVSTVPIKPFLRVYIDGASRGNPGKAGAGIFCVDRTNKTLFKNGFYLGRRTNNQAEYEALVLAAMLVTEHLGDDTTTKVIFISDSQLLVRQMSGIYKVKNAELKKLRDVATILLANTPHSFKHVFREDNTHADALANKGIDSIVKIPENLLKTLAQHNITL